MNERTEGIRVHARVMLSSGQVEYVIGYETGSDGVNARPYFAYTPDEADRLVFDATCTHNLAKYVVEPERRGKKIAVVAKPCDARAINVLLEEKQISRERVIVIGLTCEGIVQRTREDGDATSLQERCRSCDQHTPVQYDVLVGAPVPDNPATDPRVKIEQMEAQAASEREGFWAEQFDRCIRCYACRQACPQCYCSECFAETLDPEWVGISIAPSQNWMFHTIRAFHLAGRCVGCDECERVCPVKIPLSLLNGKLRKDVADLFDFRAGLNPDQPPPLETFRKDEKLGVG